MAEPDDRIWDQFITERNGRLFVSAGFDRCAGWGACADNSPRLDSSKLSLSINAPPSSVSGLGQGVENSTVTFRTISLCRLR
jgi:hypothetical protein